MQLAWYKVICAVFFETLALERCSVAEVTPIDHSSSSETTVGWIILPYRIPSFPRYIQMANISRLACKNAPGEGDPSEFIHI